MSNACRGKVAGWGKDNKGNEDKKNNKDKNDKQNKNDNKDKRHASKCPSYFVTLLSNSRSFSGRQGIIR